LSGADFDIDQYRRSFRTYNPAEIESDLEFIEEAVGIQLDFEPFRSVGDVDTLLKAAANLAMFAEEYRKRTGSLELPPE
jgi:hypothetical protein